MAAIQKPTGHISREIKVAAVELFKAGITRANICKQLKISDSSLYRILKAFQKNPLNPDLERKKGSGKKKIISPETLVKMKRLLSDTPTLTAKALKNKVPALQAVSIRRIQQLCQKDRREHAKSIQSANVAETSGRAVDPQDGGLGLPEEPGRVHAQEVARSY